jgi:hypothetical protein
MPYGLPETFRDLLKHIFVHYELTPQSPGLHARVRACMKASRTVH